MAISRYTERRDQLTVATLVMDDGKVNAFDLGFFTELDRRLDECREDDAVVVAGRDGFFSAGLNMKELATLGDDGVAALLSAFGRTMLRVWLEPRPVVAAATGHAVAGGTILAMACDLAVAADGEFRWGLTETTIGFPLPHWVITLARNNLRQDRLDDLLLPGLLVSPGQAVEAGYADETAPPEQVVQRAHAHAWRLAELPRAVYAATKQRLRGVAATEALHGMEADCHELLAEREPTTPA